LRIPESGSTEATSEVRPPANRGEPSQQELPEYVAADHSDVSAAASAVNQSIEKQDARVEELRQQYLSGSYQPDSAKVAAKIVEEHLG
jgi:anti-sigma28 factor (negative regulator of flagellin synthesis)